MRKIPAAVNTFFACGGTFLIAALPPMARMRLSARITTAMPDESIKLTPEKSSVSLLGSAASSSHSSFRIASFAA